MGGIDKVAHNLMLGLQAIHQPYLFNPPFRSLRKGDRVVFLGVGGECFRGYKRREPFAAGIGVMNHPSEFPDLLSKYPIKCFLQASEWSANMYRPFYGDVCKVWPVGIDTDTWKPLGQAKTFDFLVYYKLRWNQESQEKELLQPLLRKLYDEKLSYRLIRYGHYQPEEYKAALAECRAMLFLTEHESQGLACQEAMACDIPMLAWDAGVCCDPEQRDAEGKAPPASSVPYFDGRCGKTFTSVEHFNTVLSEFKDRLDNGAFHPREYILENLTLAKSAQQFVNLITQTLP
jgi:glycosyltransferase involved in cell wall biosynthesis